MKEGRPLAEVLTQIKEESARKRDFIVPTDKLHYTDQGTIRFGIGDQQFEATPTSHCLRQIAARSGIPAPYVDRMAANNAPLLAHNINWWWQHEPEKRMLRTLDDGKIARAFLSSGYRLLENLDLAVMILPKLQALECEILSCEVTETRFYIQAATPKMEAKVVGDTVRCGIVVGNSEVGLGSLFIDPMLYKLGCLNGAIFQRVMQRYHIGRSNNGDTDGAAEYFTDATRKADDQAFWMKVGDVTDGIFNPERFAALVTKFEGAAEQKIIGTEAVEEVTRRYGFNETEKGMILNHLIAGGSSTVFGLVNAITRTASDVESYDHSIDLQRIGGDILELPKTTWQQQAK